MYCKKTRQIRDEIRITKFHCGMFGNHLPRKARRYCERQSKKMEKNNSRHTVQNLFDLMVLNFEKDDWHLSLTYPLGTMKELEEAEKHLSNFLKRLRRYCDKTGVMLKYITATHKGKNGQYHHHIILPQYIPYAVIQAKWKADKACGNVPVNSTLWANYDYYGLAAYLLKYDTDTGQFTDGIHEQNKKRYKCSTNLERPKDTYEVIKAERWLEEPRAPHGWIVKPDSVYNSIDEYTGYPYQSYVLIPDTKRRI